jgi:hypothetical protein
MENEQNKFCCCGDKKAMLMPLAPVAILFLLAATAFLVISGFNKAKEAKYIGQNPQSPDVITVSGTGDIYSKPDLALIDFSVVNQASTVGQAMQDNTDKMNKVIEAMKAKGVDPKDLKTTSFNISPQYQYVYPPLSEISLYPYPPGKRVLSGYEVNQSLEVKIRDLAKTGDIIQAATDSGANEVGSLVFTIENQDGVKQQARTQAINEAKNKAKELAGELGVKLVKITGFSENYYYPYDSMLNERGMAGGAGASAPSIQTGENKTSVTVSLTYEIR